MTSATAHTEKGQDTVVISEDSLAKAESYIEAE